MADPLQNAQYALGLFQPGVNALANSNAQKLQVAENLRQEQLMYWKERMQQEENAKNRELQDTLNNRTVNATLQGQRESTSRLIEEQKMAEARQLHRAVLEMYKNYSDLAEGNAMPLGQFGKDDESAYEALSQELGRLRSKNLIEPTIGRLYEKYGAMGGDKKVDDFGSTPGEQLQGLSKEIGVLETKRYTDTARNIGNRLSSLDADIQKAEQPTPDELIQAKNLGMDVISGDAKKFYDRQVKAGMSKETAFQKMAMQFPADAQAFQEKVNGFIVGLRLNKQANDKTLRELYNSKSDLQNKSLMIFRDRPDLMFSGDAAAAAAPKVPVIAAPQPGLVGVNDAIRTTFRQPQPATIVPSAAQGGYVPAPIPQQVQAPAPYVPQQPLMNLGLPDIIDRLKPLSRMGLPDILRNVFGSNISGPNFSGVSIEQPSRGAFNDYVDTLYPNQLAEQERQREMEQNYINQRYAPNSLRGTP